MDYVQKLANAANENLADKVKELTADLNDKKKSEADLLNLLEI